MLSNFEQIGIVASPKSLCLVLKRAAFGWLVQSKTRGAVVPSGSCFALKCARNCPFCDKKVGFCNGFPAS
jgi:hypothetical protein